MTQPVLTAKCPVGDSSQAVSRELTSSRRKSGGKLLGPSFLPSRRETWYEMLSLLSLDLVFICDPWNYCSGLSLKLRTKSQSSRQCEERKKKTKIANFILNLREWGRSPTFSFHISLPQIPLSEIHILLPLFNSCLYEKFQLFLEYFPKHHFYHDVLLAPFFVSLTCFIFFIALISTWY